MIPPPKSLLKYDNPILISKSTDKLSMKEPSKSSLQETKNNPATSQQFSDCANKKSSLEILNSILPPRQWTEDNQLWVQHVSSAPCTRADVIHLEEQLYTMLQQRKARDTGICPIRREIYSQCFDELIRQVTMNCAERGLLLLEVRKEVKMTMDTYQMLHESSIAFGMRKAFQAEQNKVDMEKRISELENEKQDLLKQLNEQKVRCETIEKRENEKAQIEEKKHYEEIQFMKKVNQQLKAQLEEKTKEVTRCK
ncbi:axonemal dynein light intermediate polypeptide 1 [Antennarius striatus]|uniref:axonemal dynein light intermediate polypeptide 1 n=1 Tax=Antennarius striatus TaxID=241820 RepID=UPI0035B44938